MLKKKNKILIFNLIKYKISVKLFCIFFLCLIHIISYPSYASKSIDDNPVISKGWEIVFNNPHGALDFCLHAVKEASTKKDSLLEAELNRLIGTAYYYISEYPKSIEYYSLSLTYFYQKKQSLKIADLYNDIALSYLYSTKNNEAIDYFQKALNIFKRFEKKWEQSNVLGNLGLAYFYKMDFVNASTNIIVALKLADKLKEKELIAMHVNNLGMIYQSLKNYDQALKYYISAKRIFEKAKILSYQAAIFNNIGNIYSLQKKFDEAFKYLNKSFKLKKKINNKYGIAISYNNFGELYELQKDEVKALENYNNSLKIMEEINNIQGVINSTDCIARIYYKQKDLKKAELFFLRSVELGKINNIPTKTAHHFLSVIYKERNDYEKSLEHLKKFGDIEDSVFGSEKVHQINTLIANYEKAVKEDEITTLTESNRLKDEQIRERTIFLVILGSFFSALIVLIIVLYKYSKNITKSKEELVLINELKQKTNSKLQETLQELNLEIDIRKKAENELLNAQEKLEDALEKAKELNEMKTRFISMISHEYRNPLTVIMNIADFLPNLFNLKDPAVHEKYLKMIKQQVDIMVKLLNDVLIIGKKGSSEQKLPLMTMPIAELCKDVITNVRHIDEEHHNFMLHEAPGVDLITTDAQQLSHALSNMFLNSTTYSPWNTDIVVEILPKDNFYKIIIKDQGIGVPDEDKPRILEPFYRGTNIGSISGNGLGLSIVKMYMDMLQGRIEFESKENFGSTFTLILPKEIKL